MGLQGPPNGCGVFRKDSLSSGHSYPIFPTFSPEFVNPGVVIHQFPSPIPPSIGGTLRIQLPGSNLWTKKHFLWVLPFGQQCDSSLHLQWIPSVSHKLVAPLLFPPRWDEVQLTTPCTQAAWSLFYNWIAKTFNESGSPLIRVVILSRLANNNVREDWWNTICLLCMNWSQAAFCTLLTCLSNVGMEIDMNSPLSKGSRWSYFVSHTDGCGDFSLIY